MIVKNLHSVGFRNFNEIEFSPSENNKKYDKQGIWILVGNSPKRFNIELGLSDENKTQIISNEIKEKDKVIVGEVGVKQAPKKSMRPF